MGTRKDFLENVIFSDQPVNWFVHAQGFHYAGLKLVEAGEKLETRKKFVSTIEIYNRKYSYKIAVYLLSHSIELMLKSVISIHNQLNKSKPLKSPAQYSHNVISMVNDLITSKVLTIENEDYEIFKLVDEYLKWFGRYYCPQTKDIPEVIKQAYTEPDEKGLIDFKYKLKYPETHRQLKKIYDEITPKADETTLTLPYLLHSGDI